MEKLPFILRENPDGSVEVNYEDLGVELFGGADYEVNYIIDEANTKKLRSKLEEKHTGDLKQMLIKEFGEYLDKKSFATTCQEWEIDYQIFTV